MAHPLFCTFNIKSERGSTYWWPLIFEAMRWRAFNFTAPDQLEGVGYYYYVRFGNEADTDFVKASFRATWDEIFTETSEVLVSFWAPGADPFSLSVSLQHNKADHLIRLHLILEDAEVSDVVRETIKHRLRLMLDCAKALYEVCRPCTGELFWEATSATLASFGKPLEMAFLREGGIWGRTMSVVEQVLPDGSQFYFVQPMPVRVRGGWDFVSLVEEQG